MPSSTRHSILAAWLVLAFSAEGADPSLLRLLLPESKALAGMDVVEVRSTPLGKFLLGRLASDKGFEQFVMASGFDPRRDLHELMVATTADPSASALLLAKGIFDPARINPLLGGAGKSTETYHGIQILGGKQDPYVVALLDRNIALVGATETVKAAVDRRGKTGGLDPALLRQVERLGKQYPLWGVKTGPLTDLSGQSPDPALGAALEADPFKSVREIGAGVRFGDAVRIDAEALTGTEQEAATLADAVRFLLTIASAQKPKAQAFDLAALAKNAKISARCNRVTLVLELGENELEKLLP